MIETYLQKKYLTLTGIHTELLPNAHSYGEWVISSGRVPKYHVYAVCGPSASDRKIGTLLDGGTSMEIILDRVNKTTHQQLNLGRLPFFRIRISSYMITTELEPFPIEWLDGIS